MNIVVPMVVAHPRVPELFDEIRRQIAIEHPMFPGVHCLVADAKITLRLGDHCIVLLSISGFYQDDGT